MFRDLATCLSEERLAPYLVEAGHDESRALRLYEWNMDIGNSFLPLLEVVELCLRNCLGTRLSACYGEHWWRDEEFQDLLGQKGKGIVLRAEGDLRKREREPTPGRMIAELSFGFWVNMLLPKYEEPLLTPLSATFTHLPEAVNVADLRDCAERCRQLRNRISHHEPLLGRDHSLDYSVGLRLLGWLQPAALAWIKPRLVTMSILRQRP